MSGGNDQLRTAITRKFEPPIDVLLDPSLLVSSRSLERLADSNVFNSQVQATLGGSPTEPRLGDLYVPASFRELVLREGQSAVQKTSVWDFYRGQADIGYRNPAGICAFGVSNAEATADAITGGIIERESDLILYRLGD